MQYVKEWKRKDILTVTYIMFFLIKCVYFESVAQCQLGAAIKDLVYIIEGETVKKKEEDTIN